ncbi:MAG: acylase [Alphaproteobacteria bacterium]|nr:acylase [Alphaproteobacteria bacterium]
MLTLASCATTPATGHDLAALKAEAQRVSIVRDDWGIAHVTGKTDADAVFGMVYAQAEDDFNRVETNYINAMGRLAEAEGESVIWQDLRMKLFIDPDELKGLYAKSPDWLKSLMIAWADGLNYYLATHPNVKPRVITHFEPWMALSFTEGSIGGDIERVSLSRLQKFYGVSGQPPLPQQQAGLFVEPSGSNGIAIAPKNTADGHALLLINPHTSFYFRSELQMTSGEGLNTYGASTWGQFFVYQGFNERAGWMHTSSSVDVVDEFAETVSRKNGKLVYKYGAEARPVRIKAIDVPYRATDGSMAKRTFTVYFTHHGPVVRVGADGKWISIALMQKPIEALSQSWLRTKAHDLASFEKISETYKANSSNDTIFADSKGEIAYLRPQFIPIRNDRFDYTQPVDGADPATDWGQLHDLSTRPNAIEPSVGWVANSNNWPYSSAGADSPKQTDFPRYMDTVGETPRGRHDTLLLQGKTGFTLQSLRASAYDSYLTAFADLIPSLVAAYDATPESDPTKAKLAEPIAALRAWDYRWDANSIPTSLAVFWGENLWLKTSSTARAAKINQYDYMRDRTSNAEKLQSLTEAVDRLAVDFGSWRTPWGEINRFQRLNDDIKPRFSDDGPSIPVPFTSGQWGTLASFGARRYDNTKRYYGTSGNSFVAVVEFGDKVSAIAVTAGGESGDPSSPHFNDEAQRYASGDLRKVYFYPDQLAGHSGPAHHPGE